MATVEPPRRLRFLLLGIGAACLIYAVVRYHLFKGVPWSQLPLFTLNKAVSLASLVLLALSLVRGLRARTTGIEQGADASLDARRHDARRLGLYGAAAALWHGTASVILLTPPYFPALYSTETRELTAAGGAAVAAGATGLTALACLAFPYGGDARSSQRRSLVVRAVLVLTGLHTTFIGFPGWLTPSTWPGGMPPITLISSVIAFVSAAAVERPGRRS